MNQKLTIAILLGLSALSVLFSFREGAPAILTGAWQIKSDSAEEVLIFQDNYFTQTSYNKAYREFNYSRGGRVELLNDTLKVTVEFNSQNRDQVGTVVSSKISFASGELLTQWDGASQSWTRIDKGGNPLSGCWKITGRMRDNKMSPMREGPRKTVKILSGTRFQWTAVNTDTKEFFGTGGGVFSYVDGKYTETIEFFSRDSSRVGKALSFDAKLENGVWHHSGVSSRGDPVNEIWARTVSH